MITKPVSVTEAHLSKPQPSIYSMARQFGASTPPPMPHHTPRVSSKHHLLGRNRTYGVGAFLVEGDSRKQPFELFTSGSGVMDYYKTMSIQYNCALLRIDRQSIHLVRTKSCTKPQLVKLVITLHSSIPFYKVLAQFTLVIIIP